MKTWITQRLQKWLTSSKENVFNDAGLVGAGKAA